MNLSESREALLRSRWLTSVRSTPRIWSSPTTGLRRGAMRPTRCPLNHPAMQV